MKHKQSIIVGSVYCPPNSSTTILDELENTINDIRNAHPTARIFLGGDFNASGIDWQCKSLTESYVPVYPLGRNSFQLQKIFISNSWLPHLQGVQTF